MRSAKASVLGVELLAEQGGLCALCRLPLQPNGVTLDHIIPVAQGGTAIRANLQATHSKCNSWKADIANAVGYCWRCKQRVQGEAGATLHWVKRHGHTSVKHWRREAKQASKTMRAQAKPKDTPHRQRIRERQRPGTPAVPWPAPNYVPRTGPYATSNGASADGMVGSP